MSASEFWNQKYQAEEYIFGREANDFIVSVTPPALAGQTAYAPADGEGRNGVFLAMQGYQVTSTDIADLAVAKARKLAAEKQLAVNALVADALNPPLEDHSFDVIVVCFMHFRAEDEKRFMTANKRLLKPGGVIYPSGLYARSNSASFGGA